jgi:acetyl esterase/lipase
MKFFNCLLFLISNMAMSQQLIQLYESSIPNSKVDASVTEKSEVGADGILRISNVTEPTLTVFLPESGKSNGTSIIICPGGGYWILAAGHEGADVARQFVKMGVTAFVLKYRLPDAQIQTNPAIAPWQDAQRAIQLVRERASEWNIDPTKIGILGFSAGGHLASTAGTKFENSVIDNNKQISLRPDFMVLVYPVISADPAITHQGSFEKLLGINSTAEKRMEYSSDRFVSKDTPPTFLVHASDDGGVSPQNSIVFYQALLEKKVPVELHLYQQGGHGFGLKNSTTPDLWMDRLRNWLKTNKWI